MRRFRQLNQAGKHISEFGALRAAESKIDFAVEGVELLVSSLGGDFRLKDFVGRADFILRFLDGLENAGSKKSKNGGAEAHDIARGNEHAPAQPARINLIENVIFLGDAAGLDDAASHQPGLYQAWEDDVGVQSD